MNPIAITFDRFVPGQGDAEKIGTVYINPTSPEEWVLAPEQLARKQEEMWQTVDIPGGETIEVAVYVSTDTDGISMFVRQDGASIAQLQCNGLCSMTFRTLGGELIGLESYDREQFDAHLP